jgi:hypothetical protein
MNLIVLTSHCLMSTKHGWLYLERVFWFRNHNFRILLDQKPKQHFLHILILHNAFTSKDSSIRFLYEIQNLKTYFLWLLIFENDFMLNLFLVFNLDEFNIVVLTEDNETHQLEYRDVTLNITDNLLINMNIVDTDQLASNAT